jgi:hypothetical protein
LVCCRYQENSGSPGTNSCLWMLKLIFFRNAKQQLSGELQERREKRENKWFREVPEPIAILKKCYLCTPVPPIPFSLTRKIENFLFHNRGPTWTCMYLAVASLDFWFYVLHQLNMHVHRYRGHVQKWSFLMSALCTSNVEIQVAECQIVEQQNVKNQVAEPTYCRLFKL